MADLSNYIENAFANALRGGGNGVSYTAPAAIYAQLHTGVPGEDGIANVSGTTERQEIEFGAASNGEIVSTTAPEWASWSAGAETVSHVSIWDADEDGNCIATGVLASSKTMADGDTFRLPIGNVTLTIS